MSHALNPLQYINFCLENERIGSYNFCVLASYTGALDGPLLQRAVPHLQKMHPLLQMAPNSADKVTHFVQTSAQVPFTEHKSPWKEIVQSELSHKITQENQPLWRVALLKEETGGKLVITFHHSIADGVSAPELVHHLFTIITALQNNETLPICEGSRAICDLTPLYSLCNLPPPLDAAHPQREDKGYHTNFIYDCVDEATTARTLQWAKLHDIKASGVLFAAFMLAVHTASRPSFDTFLGITAVNLRPYFAEPISRDTLTALATVIADNFPVKPDLLTLARQVHTSVHTQLQLGIHTLALKTYDVQQKKGVSAQELWPQLKLPDNALVFSNIGPVSFTGQYEHLSLRELTTFSNLELLFESPHNFHLGILTFQQKFFMSLRFIHELVPEDTAQAIMAELKQILEKL